MTGHKYLLMCTDEFGEACVETVGRNEKMEKRKDVKGSLSVTFLKRMEMMV